MSSYGPPRSAEEVTARYNSGGRFFPDSELDGAVYDFRGADLTGANFSGSMIFADFRGARLISANFSECNIKTCDFRGADLRDAIFCGARLEGTEFVGAILTGADFEGAGMFNENMQAGELPDW